MEPFLWYSSQKFYPYLAALDNYLQWVDAGGTLWVEVHAYGGYSLEAKIHDIHLYFR